MATRALTPTIRAAHTSKRTPHHTGTLRRNGHGPGSPTQSETPHQNICLGGHGPRCIHNTPTPNHTNAREIPPPTTPFVHRSLEQPSPTRHHPYHTNTPTHKLSHRHRHNHSQPTHLFTVHTKNTPKIRPQELALKHIIRLIHCLYTSQPQHIGYILANTPSPNKHASIQEELGPAITLDGPPRGSGA
jgi:hypothetical protein